MLHIAIQMDDPLSLNMKGDTTLLLAYGALQRGHLVKFFSPSSVSYLNNRVFAKIGQLEVTFEDDEFSVSLGQTELQALEEYDVVLIRQNPPFDMTYMTNAFLLERISDKTLVLNSPHGLRNNSEKLMVLDFKDDIPQTLISLDVNAIKDFYDHHQVIVAKPLYEFGGSGVHKIESFDKVLELLEKDQTGLPFIFQNYLAAVTQGDKRLILFDGELIGGFKRVPAEGQFLSNMVQGAKPVACELTQMDKNLCEKVGPYLRERGLFIAGLDIIGDRLIEINVTSPTGLVPLNKLSGIQSEQIFWEKAESIVRNKNKDGSQYYNRGVSGSRRPTH